MTFIEFIGFVVSLLAMIYLFFKQIFDQRRRQANPEAYDKELEERGELIRRLMKGEDVAPSKRHSASKKNGCTSRPSVKPHKEMQKKKVVSTKPLPVPTLLKKGKGIDPYSLKQIQEPTPIESALNHLDSRKELVILSEIYGPPKGFQ